MLATMAVSGAGLNARIWLKVPSGQSLRPDAQPDERECEDERAPEDDGEKTIGSGHGLTPARSLGAPMVNSLLTQGRSALVGKKAKRQVCAQIQRERAETRADTLEMPGRPASISAVISIS
jgi:hypothetical protein